ncbi:MAG: transcription elongation factor GreA [Pseudomonadota bacterium]
MSTTRTPMTPNGKKLLEERLKYLKSVERPQNIAAIEEARNHGDLSENAEYDAAKERQLQISTQIQEIEHKLSLAHVIDPAAINSEKIVFGATVTMRNLDNDDQATYTIVGVDEADIKHGKISIESPIARALISRQVGDEVKVRTPKGIAEYEVIKIEYR